jgi:uncharacterized protein YutE (UPF0331/DUF86 family)
MKKITVIEIREIINDINNEINKLAILENEIKNSQLQLNLYPELKKIIYESLALKLHNFYTGCERIFQIIASELNGGLPSSYDWHRRLLERMSTDQSHRIAVITETTAKYLKDYLAFRHVIRNIYGFEIEEDKINELIEKYSLTWLNFTQDMNNFLQWLEELANSLENYDLENR